MRVLLSVIVLLAWITPGHAADSAYERVTNNKTLRCGYLVSPPVLLKDPNTGQLSGMDYDAWESIGRQLDLKIEWVEASGWGTFIEDLKSGRFDAYCTQIWLTPGRTLNLSLSNPVAYSFLNAYVRPDDTRFDADPNRLNAEDVTIPVIDADIIEHVAKVAFPKAKRLSLQNNTAWPELYLSVTTKKADVILVHAAGYESISANNPIKLKKVNKEPVFTFGARYSVLQGEYALRDMINAALQSMIDDGSLEKFAKASSPDIIIPTKNYSKTAK